VKTTMSPRETAHVNAIVRSPHMMLWPYPFRTPT